MVSEQGLYDAGERYGGGAVWGPTSVVVIVPVTSVPGWTPPVLDARKRAWLLQNRATMRADRATVMVGVIVSAGAGLEYVVLRGCVFRRHMASDQTLALTEGTAQIDAVVEMPLMDTVTGQQNDPKVFAYLALTAVATAGAVAIAEKYEVVSYKTGGMVDNRYVVQLRRFR